MGLPENFVDAILDSTMDGKRRVKLTEVSGGVYIVEDVTVYSQEGSNFGALQINNISKAVNKVALMENVTLYVSKAGSDVTGDGTSGKPFATITMALAMVPKNLNGFNASIRILDGGTYDEKVLVCGFHGGMLKIYLYADITVKTFRVEASTDVVVGTNSGVLTMTTTDTTGIPVYAIQSAYLYSWSVNFVINGSSSYDGICASEFSKIVILRTVTVNNAKKAIASYSRSSIYCETIAGTGNLVGLFGDASASIAYLTNNISAITPESMNGGSKIMNKVIDESRITSNNTVTEANKFGICATQLNKNVADSLAQKDAQLFGTEITILTSNWVTDDTDARYPWTYTKTFASMGTSTSFGLIATATNGLTTALEDTENGYVVKGVADNTAKTIKFYATAKPTGSLKYLVKGVTL